MQAALTLCLALTALVTLGASLVSGAPDLITDEVLAAPDWAHPLGTDSIGRDVLVRTLIGARSSIAIALAASALTLLFGTAVGVAAGCLGGVADFAGMRLVEMLMSVPPLLIAIAVLAAVGPSVPTLIAVLTLTYIPQTIRVVRASTLQIRGKGYVDAARISRVSSLSIMLTHILPNIRGLLIVQASVSAAHMLLVETILSFLGLGVQPPVPSLGFMISEGRQWMEFAPWVVVGPGVMIVLAVATVTVLGQALDRALRIRR